MSLMRLSHNPPSPESFQIHLFVRQRIPFQILFYLRQQASMHPSTADCANPTIDIADAKCYGRAGHCAAGGKPGRPSFLAARFLRLST
jgi:hypothetical protein